MFDCGYIKALIFIFLHHPIINGVFYLITYAYYYIRKSGVSIMEVDLLYIF